MVTGGGGRALSERLTTLLRPVVTEAGYDLEDVVVTPAGKRRLLRLIVDRDGGVDLDGVAELARVASQALDASDAMGPGPYVLEVTSPGVDRPLTEPRHWRRAVGRLVTVTLRGGGSVTGRIREASPDAVTVDDGKRRHDIALADTVRGVVRVEFARPDEPEAEPAPAEVEEARA